MKTYVDAEIESLRRAVDKFETTNNAKFAEQNEWRGQSKDREAKYLTRNELWVAVIAVATLLVAMYFK